MNPRPLLSKFPWLLLLLGIPHMASAQESSSVRPPFQFLRWAEDWSKFHADEGPLDPLKHLRLTDDGSVWASFGARAEARLESWDDFAFGPMVSNDDSFAVWRVLAHADLHVGEHLRLFVEGKTAQATERDLPGGRRTLDADYLDLQELFVDARVPFGEASQVTLRAGRQMYSFGAQRLVSPLPWGNTLRTWEGVTAVIKGGAWTTTALASAFVPTRPAPEGSNPCDPVWPCGKSSVCVHP
jgi:hypothetical protein